MIRLILLLPYVLLSCIWVQASPRSFADCSASPYSAQRGDLVCEEGQVQVNEVFDYDLLESWQAVNERAGGLGIPGFLLNLLVSVKYRLKGYRVEYWTLGANPDGLSPAPMVKATGLVVIPQNVGCQLPLALYCHGTIFGRDNVPSQPENYQEEFLAALGYAGSGYFTVLPDYVGMGEGDGDFHPYLDSRTEAAASIDMMRAARKLADDLNTSLSGQVFIAGHSQGGHAGMATLKSISKDYRDEFDVKFAGLSSGPYDLSGTQFHFIYDHPDTYPASELLLMVLAGCQEANCGQAGHPYYCDNQNVLEPDLIIDPYELYIKGQDAAALGEVDLQWPEYFLDDYEDDLPDSQLRNECLAQNDVYNWKNLNRTTLFYCSGDERVDPENSIKTKKVQRSKIPWYRFWERWQINTFNSGDLDHVTCALPSLYFTRIAFNLNRKFCLFYRSESPDSVLASPEQAPPFLFFDMDVDLRPYTDRLTRVDLINLNDEVVRSWEGEILMEDVLTIRRGDLEPGMYGLALYDEMGGVEYKGILVQDPEPAVSELYDPISPNPMREEAVLDLSLLEEPVIKLSIYDLDGNLQRRIPLDRDARSQSLQRGDLRAGEYLVEVRSTRQSYFLPLRVLPQTQGSLKISPNPARDLTWLDLASIEGEVLGIRLFSAEGRLVRTYAAPGLKAERYQINTRDLPTGVYYIEVTTDRENVFGKMVVE